MEKDTVSTPSHSTHAPEHHESEQALGEQSGDSDWGSGFTLGPPANGVWRESVTPTGHGRHETVDERRDAVSQEAGAASASRAAHTEGSLTEAASANPPLATVRPQVADNTPLEKQDEESSDDENYEITDFSMVTPWERMIQDIEDVLISWGLKGGGMGDNWDVKTPTREHTVLNSSGTRGVRHRMENLEYNGSKFALRHVQWLPEGSVPGSGGVCGVETIWRKRSSAATSGNCVHELGCCLGLANYLILSPDESQSNSFLSAKPISLQECTLLRSALAIAQRNISCHLAGLTPTGPRGGPGSYADFPFTFFGLACLYSQTTRFSCYLDAQASRETADSMRSPFGAVQYMRARHCFPRDHVKISVRDTHYLVIDGVNKGRASETRDNESVRTSGRNQVCPNTSSVSDLPWGSGSEPIDRLSLEMTWEEVDEEMIPRPSNLTLAHHSGGLQLETATHVSVACQFVDDLPCPMAEALDRVCSMYQQSLAINNFSEVWDGDDAIRYAFKRGISSLRDSPPPSVEKLSAALEDCLPSDPEGYTISGQCVASYFPSPSEAEVARGLRIKAAPAGSLLALLAKHVADEQVSSSLKYIALLWGEFVSEIRWFWDQGIQIPRLPNHEDGTIDTDCCLIHQKLQLINLCIKKKKEEESDPSIDTAAEEFDSTVMRESQLSSLLMMGIPGEAQNMEEGEEKDETVSPLEVQPSMIRDPEEVLATDNYTDEVFEDAPEDQTEGMISEQSGVQRDGSSEMDNKGKDNRGKEDKDERASNSRSSGPPTPTPSTPTPSTPHQHSARSLSAPNSGTGIGLVPRRDSASESMDSTPVGDTRIPSDHAAEGVKGRVEGLCLLHTGEWMNEPLTQDHPRLTEDRLEEQQMLMMNATPSSRSVTLRAKLSGGLRALKSDMSAFQAANPGCCLEDFVRWYSPRDWLEMDDDRDTSEAPSPKKGDPKATKARGKGKPPKGRLSQRMSTPGNAWIECWKSVLIVPAHKQKKLFDHHKEAERTLHDLEILPPSQLLHEILNCACVNAFHSLYAAMNQAEVNSVSVTLARVKHLLWCGEDQGRPLDKEHCDDVCTAFALAERQVTKATSLLAKLDNEVGNLIDDLCTTGRAAVSNDAEKSKILSLVGSINSQEELSSDEDLPKPQVREYVCKGSGGRGKGYSQHLFVRSAPDLFRIASSTTTPSV